MPRIARFLRLPRSAERIRADIDDEITFDIEMRAARLVAQGMARAGEARSHGIRRSRRHPTLL